MNNKEDRLADDVLTDQVRKEFFERRIGDAERLIPTPALLHDLDQSVKSIVNHLVTVQPDCVITTGRSSLVSRILLDRGFRGCKKRFFSIQFDDNLNQLLYKSMYPEEMTEEERMQRLRERLSSRYGEVVSPGRTIIVDEFMRSGMKAVEVLCRMHELGVSRVSWASFFAGPDLNFQDKNFMETMYGELVKSQLPQELIERLFFGNTGIDLTTDVYIASRDQSGMQYLQELSNLLTVTKLAVYDEPRMVNDISLPQKLTKSVARILRVLAST